jgi:hypothetical protein
MLQQPLFGGETQASLDEAEVESGLLCALDGCHARKVHRNWRRVRDSNPRRAFDPYTLSRGAPSTTRPTLRLASATIAEALVAEDESASVLIITGSPMLHAFRLPPRIDYVKLPCLNRSDVGQYDVKHLAITQDSARRMRCQHHLPRRPWTSTRTSC